MRSGYLYRKNRQELLHLIGFIAVPIVTLFLFLGAISSLSAGNVERQKESLERALERDITSCYAVEGQYPDSLAYIKENYGLYYNEELFFVDYRVYGSNLRPEVTIIVREDAA